MKKLIETFEIIFTTKKICRAKYQEIVKFQGGDIYETAS